MIVSGFILTNGQIYRIFTMLPARESGDLANFSDHEYILLTCTIRCVLLY